MGVHRLCNPIQEYAWGSRTALPDFLGRPSPSERPWAELWMGAHPRAASRVETDEGWRPLGEAIAERPAYWLGEALAARASGLPFLFKVLAIAQPLSLQLHPDALQAAAGFAREEAAGVPLDAPERLYRDTGSKRELICALTPTRALCGLRPLERQGELLAELRLPELADVSPAAGDDDLAWLAALLRLPDARRKAVARAAACAAAERAGRRPELAGVAELARSHPDDVAILAPLLLESVELAPGDALLLEPGELHCYLEGTALELMESSDNVVRAGLTPKAVDVDELLALASDGARAPETLRAEPCDEGESAWPLRTASFALSRLELAPGRRLARSPEGPEILLCTRGEARVAAGDTELPLARGEAVFVAAGAGVYAMEGDAELHRARVPDPIAAPPAV